MRSFARLVAGAAAVVVMVGLATAPAAAADTPAGVSGFNGTYSGLGYRYVNLTDHQLAVVPADLGTGGSVTFTTTIKADQYAAQWGDSTAELIIAGWQPVPRGTSQRLYGDGSLIYAQDNSMGAGYCANDQFFSHTTGFVFGSGAACYVHSTPPPSGQYGSTETYSVTIFANNKFKDTVTIDSGCSNCSTGPYSSSATATFTGMLSAPATTAYYPALHLLPGRTSQDETNPWTFTVSNSSS